MLKFLLILFFVWPVLAKPKMEPLVTGYQIMEVKPGSVADQLGLKKGDVVKKYNGRLINTNKKARDLFANFGKEDKIDIVIERDGKEMTLHYRVKAAEPASH